MGSGTSAEMMARFDILGATTSDGSQTDFELTIAVEMIEQMRGGLTVEATGLRSLRLEVSVPLVARDARR